MADFFAMGGYALYVWGSFGVTALCMIVEPILVSRRHRTLITQLGRMIRMNSEGES